MRITATLYLSLSTSLFSSLAATAATVKEFRLYNIYIYSHIIIYSDESVLCAFSISCCYRMNSMLDLIWAKLVPAFCLGMLLN